MHDRPTVSILKELCITTWLTTIRSQRILDYFGHVARRDLDSLEKLMVIDHFDAKRPYGHPQNDGLHER